MGRILSDLALNVKILSIALGTNFNQTNIKIRGCNLGEINMWHHELLLCAHGPIIGHVLLPVYDVGQ